MVTMKQVKEQNPVFDRKYGILPSDIEKVNKYISVIEGTRDKDKPMPGDKLIFTDSMGFYYENAHIQQEKEDMIEICEQPHTPFVSLHGKNAVRFSTSGGAWKSIPIKNLKYIGTAQKQFHDFGHCGGAPQGTVYFNATVNVWEYTEEQHFPFTTKTHNQTSISFVPKRLRKDRYMYFALTDGIAWETALDLQAWVETFRGKLYKGKLENQIIAWTWKEKQIQVSPDEYEKIEGIEDSMQHNGIIKCKRVYDEENFIVNTYYVWHWKDETIPDLYERIKAQQDFQKKHYSLPWQEGPNRYAKNKILSGEITPVNFTTLYELED